MAENAPPTPPGGGRAFEPLSQAFGKGGTADLRGLSVLVGTKKGLFFLRALTRTAEGSLTGSPGRDRFELKGPAFLGHIVHHAIADPRDRRTLLAALRTGHLGPTVFRSTDYGRTWQEASKPPAFAKARDGRKSNAVEQVFWLTPGHVSEPGAWYAGTSPEGLFRSEDGGATWSPVSGWNDNP